MDNLTAGNPRAHAIRVYYNDTDTIYEGMPVCYNYDTDTNWFGGSVADTGEVTATTTTADGSQNERRYIEVESPSDNNLMSFAGVVKRGGWCGKSGARVLDIYVPNGAIVPVRCDADTTEGVTILAITVDSQELGVPVGGTSRPVAIAAETETGLDGTTDITLATLDPNRFIYQTLDGTPLNVGVGTSSLILNETYVTSALTGGYFHNYVIKTQCTGTLAAAGGSTGILNYLDINGSWTGGGYIRGILSQLNISGTINGPFHVAAVMAQVSESGSGTVTNMEHISCLWCDCTGGLKASGSDLACGYSMIKLSNNSHAEEGPGEVFYVYGGNGVAELFDFHTCLNGGGATDHFIYPHGTGDLAYVKNTTGAILKIKCDVDGTAYYLMLYSDPVEAR